METEIKSHYNYQEVILWLEKKGVELYGNHFKMLETDYLIIYKLIAYFLNDEAKCFQYGIDLNKGILLSGPIGCGKTSLMNLMRLIPEQERKFILKPTREISFEFIKEGYEVIQRYSSSNKLQNSIKNYCFDDLGIENNLKYFGNECNVMGEILLSRYDLFINKKIITHITTNLSASEIEAAYGNRVRSRLRQMLNLIAFNPITKDKR